MPPIDIAVLDCTVYLYPSRKAAKNGASYGGSGFLLAIPFEQDIDGLRRSHIYVVTNSHVVRESKSPVIRLNTIDGKDAIIQAEYKHWIDNWDEDDLALFMLDDKTMHKYAWLAPMEEALMTKNDVLWGLTRYSTVPSIEWGTVTIGSDTVTIGRFLAFDGKQKNLPVVRFGNISALPFEPIDHSKERPKQESFLVECRTFPGASGSPVFTTRPLGEASGHKQNKWVEIDKLLGVVWGYSFRIAQVPLMRNHKGQEETVANVHAEQNTGMMLVIPAWKLAKFLNREDLVMERKRIEQQAIYEAENR